MQHEPHPKAAGRGAPLLAGLAAGALALSLRRGGARAWPLAALAAAGLGVTLLRWSSGATSRAAEEAEAGAAPELVRSAVVDGILMRWEEHGEKGGVPVVMVHGIPTHPRLWRHVIPHLAGSGARCLAWEMVGFGWSMEAGLRRDVSLAAQARYLDSWLRHLGIERAVFVGHDLGGGVLQRLAVAEPERFAGLVLTDCVAYDNWPVAPVRAARSMAGVIRELPPALLKPVFLAGLLDLGHDRGKRRAASAALHWQPYNRSIGPSAFAHQLRHLDVHDTLEPAPDLRRLDMPARVVWGDEDPLGMPSAERLSDDLGAPLRRIPGARHFTPEDHPDMIAAATREVIAEAFGTAEASARRAEV